MFNKNNLLGLKLDTKSKWRNNKSRTVEASLKNENTFN